MKLLDMNSQALAAILLSFISFSSPPLAFGAPNSAESQLSASAIQCKTGFKAGKTPISLKTGDKVGCYNVKLADTAKKLLTTDMSKSCFACHASGGITPVSKMNKNLRKQGYTLTPSSISSAFRAHSSEMAGASLSTAQAKAISNYLQSIK